MKFGDKALKGNIETCLFQTHHVCLAVTRDDEPLSSFITKLVACLGNDDA